MNVTISKRERETEREAETERDRGGGGYIPQFSRHRITNYIRLYLSNLVVRAFSQAQIMNTVESKDKKKNDFARTFI